MFVILLLLILALVLSVMGATNQSGSTMYVGLTAYGVLFVCAIMLHFYQKSALRKGVTQFGILTSPRLRVGVSTFTLLFSPVLVVGVGWLMWLASSAPSIEYLLATVCFVFVMVILYIVTAPVLSPYRFDIKERMFTIPAIYSGNEFLYLNPFVRKKKLSFSDIEFLLIGTRDDIKAYCHSAHDPYCEIIGSKIKEIESEEQRLYANSRYAGLGSPVLAWTVSKVDHVLCIKTSDDVFVRSVNTISEDDLVRLGNSIEKEGLRVVNYIKKRRLHEA
jgi:hypothetical protein